MPQAKWMTTKQAYREGVADTLVKVARGMLDNYPVFKHSLMERLFTMDAREQKRIIGMATYGETNYWGNVGIDDILECMLLSQLSPLVGWKPTDEDPIGLTDTDEEEDDPQFPEGTPVDNSPEHKAHLAEVSRALKAALEE